MQKLKTLLLPSTSANQYDPALRGLGLHWPGFYGPKLVTTIIPFHTLSFLLYK